MYTQIPFANDKVLGLRIEGKITSDMLDEICQLLDDKLAHYPKARVYVEMPAFEGMSAEAFFSDLKYSLGHWSRFEREAVVTDQHWLEVVVGLTGRLLPQVEVKVFPTCEVDAARDWIQAL